MLVSSLHLLLTYQCTLECEHCFVWGSPRQTGTMTLAQYADACHLCDEARRRLRPRFPPELKPDQMYGVPVLSATTAPKS